MNRAAIHDPRAPHLTMGDRVADRTASAIGSWRFVIAQTVLTVAWIVLNLAGWLAWKWDPYPFILLNLCYSFQAGFTGPILLLASNRQAAKDRALAAKDDEELAELLTINRRLMAMQVEQTDAHRTEMTMLRQLLGKRKAAGE